MKNNRTTGWGIFRVESGYLWSDIFVTKHEAHDGILKNFLDWRKYGEDIGALTQRERDSELKRIWRQEGLCAVRVELVIFEP